MSIWILAFVLCAIFAAIGFFSGAIRTAMLWLGVLLASMLTRALAPKLTGLMPKIGIKHPLWVEVSPYIMVFALIALVIYGIGFAIHHKVALIYKYQRDDFSRIKWERMNSHVGLSLGLVIAVMLFFTVSHIAYAGGYLTAQVAEDPANPAWVKFLTAARTDMQTTGFERAMAAGDKTPQGYYDAADIIGIILNNPQSQIRLANYPPFLSLGQRAELQEVAADKEYNELIFTKPAFGTIINHANTQRLLANKELIEELKKIDLQDLKNYLLTGKSKFDEEKILGRWILDKDAVMTHVRKTRPDIKGNDLMAMKKGVEALPDLTVINTLDNKTIVKTEGADAAAAAPADPNAAPTPQPGAEPGMPERYRGMRPPQQQATRPAPPVAKPTVAPPAVLRISGEGAWKTSPTGGYEISITDAAGKPLTLAASVESDVLTLSKDNLSLVFNRAE